MGPEQSRNNGVFHPKKESEMKYNERAKTDSMAKGSVMRWRE